MAAQPRLGASRRPQSLAAKGAELVAVKRNPIDAVWADRPEPSKARLVVQPEELAGKSSADKRHDMADWLVKEGADAAVLAALDSIAWTFNVRGADVTHTPVALAYAVVNADGTADLFVDGEKVGDDVAQHLGNGVRLHERDAFEPYLKSLDGKMVAVDPERSVAAITQALEQGGATHPRAAATRRCCPRRSRMRSKSPGIKRRRRATGRRCRGSCAGSRDEAPKGGLDEIIASDKLEALRREHGDLKDL